MIGLLKSSLNVALFHRLEWFRLFEEYSKRPRWKLTRLLTLSACFGTTKPDFSELK